MHVAIIWHCDMIDLNVQGMTPIALHSNASYYPYSQVLCGAIQCPLGFATLDKAAALGLATSRAVTDLRQYINSDLGYSDLKI